MTTNIELARQLLNIESKAIQRTAELLNEQFDLAIEAIETAATNGNKVIFSGIGKSHYIASKLTASFLSVGIHAAFVHPTEALHGDLGAIQPNDVCILFSKSGSTAELTALVPFLKTNNNKIISITGGLSSRLAELSDVVIDASIEKEACPINMVPTASTTVALAIGDALLSVVATNRGFSKENFAVLHPGGSIGRRLHTTIDQVLHNEDQVAHGSSEAALSDVAKAMSEKNLGAFCVVDDNMKLMGVITEGDMRKTIANNSAIDQMKAADIMTTNPVVVRKEMNLQDTLEIMEQGNRKIGVAPVVDVNGILLGLVRLHDII